MKISDYISDLLLFHEKVILPGFGAFFITREPARFEGNTAFPPRISIRFNPEDTLDDALLSSKIAAAEEIEMDEANQRVLEFVDEIKFSLNKGENFIMPGFGELYQDEDNNYVFRKDHDYRIDFETNGFESFELDPIEDQNVYADEGLENESLKTGPPIENSSEELIPEDADALTLESFEESDPIEEKKSNRGFLWILGGSIVVILVSFAIIALSTDLFDNLNTGIFKSVDKKPDSGPSIIIGSDKEFEKEFESAIDSLNKLEQAIGKDELSDMKSLMPSVYSEFHIIAGSFSVSKNAEDLQKELNMLGYPSVIIDRNDGFYRVSAVSFTDKEEALRELEKFIDSTSFKAAWVLGIN